MLMIPPHRISAAIATALMAASTSLVLADPPTASSSSGQATPAQVSSKSSDVEESTATSAKASDREGPRVHLNFRDEEWLPALNWLSKELNLNLDWQTLPEGKLSLFSSKDYSLSEAEDLINMQLLARGYTLLKRGEVLRLVPMKDIDITLVPRVTPEELNDLQKHQVARVSIPLEWMIADKAATEFKPLLSPFGQMFPMASSNRLEVLDAVVNLRELVRLLQRAESDDGRRIRVMEFRLKHRKAVEIAVQVRQLIGLPPDGSSSVSTQTQLDIEQTRFKAEAVKQLGSNARELLTDKKQDTFLVVNEKENSIVVNAPPDKLEMVQQTIETLDKPLPENDSSWQTVSRVKVHPVNGFDPETISKLLLALQERGNLAKETRIQHESAYNRIIAFASPEDQLTIAQLIESYRAEKRTAAVIPVTNVSPEYAVKAVQLILKNPERPAQMPGVASDGKFQIEADPEHRRVLLWATSDELKEVKGFLASLGETDTPVAATNASAQLHVVSIGAHEIPEVTARLKEIWSDISDSPLVIERKADASLKSSTPPSIEPTEAEPTKAEPAGVKPSTGQPKTTANGLNGKATDGLMLVSSTAGASGAVEPASVSLAVAPTAAPVRIIEGKRGDLVIVSRDPQAASTAKNLLQQLIPEPGDMRAVPLKHAQAVLVRNQLEEMLSRSIRPITSAASIPKLATPTRPMTIDADARTNRLILNHCTAAQLELVYEYLAILDQPTEDERLLRTQRVVRIKHRRATEVAEVMKDSYRDLINISERMFASYSSRRPVGYNRNVAATASNPEYQGLLSITPDTEANSLIISAPGYLIDEIVKLAESIDTAVDGPAVAIVPAAGDAGDIKMREALSKILRRR